MVCNSIGMNECLTTPQHKNKWAIGWPNDTGSLCDFHKWAYSDISFLFVDVYKYSIHNDTLYNMAGNTVCHI